MLLNATHLLPDDSGALICPKHRLIAVADPIHHPEDRQAADLVGPLLRPLATLLRQRRPALFLWLGHGLPRLLAEDRLCRRDRDELTRLQRETRWVWICDSPPAGLDAECLSEIKAGSLIFRATGQPSMTMGEIAAYPPAFAAWNEQNWPAYVLDGRKMLLPPFGPQAGSHNVLLPPAQSLFRRPFHALLLMNGRLVTKLRAELDPVEGHAARRTARIEPVSEPAFSLDGPPMRGTRMQLFRGTE